jgi:hypothetical protein
MFLKLTLPACLLLILSVSFTQTARAGDSMASSVGLYVYPANGQSTETQSKDDHECFTWAKSETGHDPMNPGSVVVAVEQPQSGPSGSIVRGAARGAVLGEVANDDAGKGAAYGAAAGAVRGRRAKKAQAHEAQQQAKSQGQQIEQQRNEEFKNAMKACLSGRGYSVS